MNSKSLVTEVAFLAAKKEVKIAKKKPFTPAADSTATDKRDIQVSYSTNQRIQLPFSFQFNNDYNVYTII